jgi:hypothetical protein
MEGKALLQASEETAPVLSKLCVRQGITLVPVKALASLDAAHQSRCAAVSKVHNGMLGLAQRAACSTRACVSMPESQVRCLTYNIAKTAKKQLCVPNKLARLGWTTSFSLPLPLPKLPGLALKDEGE